MRYFFKSFSFLMLAMACAPQRKVETRAPAPRPVVDRPAKLSGRELNANELIKYFFASGDTPDACQVLGSMSRASASQERFRILEYASVHPGSHIDSQGRMRKKDCTMVCLNPVKWGSVQCRLCREEALDLVDIWGRVGVGSHPVYEIALQSVEMPNRDEFMQLVSEERKKFGLVLWPFFDTYKILMNLGVKDAISVRNKIIQERIDEAFPAAFKGDDSSSKMENSLSLALIMNALPNYSSMLVLPHDSEKEKSRKMALMKELSGVLSKPLPYFRSDSWIDFSDDAVKSLNASVRSLQSSNPVQHACAMALLHRNFAQMIRIVGYSRLPTKMSSKGNTSFAVPLDQMLGTPDGTRFAVCPTPGSFVQNGTRVMLSEEIISNYAGSQNALEISGKIEPLARCQRSSAKVYRSEDLNRIAFGKASERATVEDNLALMRVLSHQLTAFNPGSTWWGKSPNGYPLGEFTDFETIERSGSVLPYQYHALALGLLQITVDTLLNKFLVQVDAEFKETKVDSEVIGIRLSSRPRKAGDKAVLTTSVDSALVLAEIAFKAGAYLKQVPQWRAEQEKFYASEFKKLGSEIERFNYSKMNHAFVQGLYGNNRNLNMISGTINLPNGTNVMKQVDQLKVASALLLATFAETSPRSTASEPRYTCAAKIVTDPLTGREVKEGRCTPAQEKLWKKTFSWLSDIYKSPLFAGYAL